MPANKFHGYYYGLGMKLDEQSVEKAGAELQDKLSAVVKDVVKEAQAMSAAITSGIADVNGEKLAQALKSAYSALDNLEDFNPKKLKQQIADLDASVKGFTGQLTDVRAEVDKLATTIEARLSNIEITTSDKGKNLLVDNLKAAVELAKSYQEIMKSGGKVEDTSGLDAQIVRLRKGLNTIQSLVAQNGASMSEFVDEDIIKGFTTLNKLLFSIGKPVDNITDELYSLATAFKDVVKESELKGRTAFADMLQLGDLTKQLHTAQNSLHEYEREIDKFQRRANSTGFDISAKDDKILDFDAKIDRIDDYDRALKQLTKGSEEWFTTYQQMIALIQSAEKEMSHSTDLQEKWSDAFGYSKRDFSSSAIEAYTEYAQKELDRLTALQTDTLNQIEDFDNKIAKLTGESRKTVKGAGDKAKQKIQLNENIDLKAHIDTDEWNKAIYEAVKKLNGAEFEKTRQIRLKPYMTKQALQDSINKNLKKGKKTVEKAGEGTPKEGINLEKSVESADERIRKRLTDLVAYIQKEWRKQIAGAFAFRFEIGDVDEEAVKTLTQRIDKYLLSLVDVINGQMATKPIVFTSNINKLIEEVKSKLENLKLDGGDINFTLGGVNPLAGSLNGLNLILQGVASSAEAAGQAIQGASAGEETPSGGTPVLTSAEKPTRKSSKQIQAEFLQAFIEGYGKLDEKSKGKVDNSLTGISSAVRNISKNKTWDTYVQELLRFNDLEKILNIKPGRNKALKAWLDQIREAQGYYAHTMKGEFVSGQEVNKAKIQLEHGKEMIKGYIRWAEIAKKLGVINASPEVKVTEDMFGDKNAILVNGQAVDRRFDLDKDGKKIVNGHKISAEDVEQFLKISGWSPEDIQAAVKKEKDRLAAQQAGEPITNELRDDFLDPLKRLVAMYIEARNLVEEAKTKGLSQKDIDKRQGALTSAVNAVGTEAHNRIVGKKDYTYKFVKEQDPLTKQWQRVWNAAKGGWDDKQVYKIVEEGIRGFMRSLQVVIQNEVGESLLGFNLGKEIVPPDKMLYSGGESWTKIITALNAALEIADKILFNKKRIDGVDVLSYEKPTTPKNTTKSGATYTDWTTAQTEKGRLESHIAANEKTITAQSNSMSKNEEKIKTLDAEKDKDEIARLTAENKRYAEQIAHLKQVNAEHREKISSGTDNTIRIGQYRADIAKREAENKQYTEQIAQLKAQIGAEANEDKRDDLKSQRRSINAKLTSNNKEIESLKRRIAELEAQPKTPADNKKIFYSKTYTEAERALPNLKAAQEYAQGEIEAFAVKFTKDASNYMSKLTYQAVHGELDPAEAKQRQDTIPNIIPLNEQLKKNEITQEQYIKQVTDFYQTATGKVSEDLKKEIERQAVLMKNLGLYAEEEKILKRIIEVYKPQTPYTSASAPAPTNGSPTGGTPTQGGATGTFTAGGSIGTLSLNTSDLAKDGTLQTIYHLLLGGGGKGVSDNNSKIEEPKSANEALGTSFATVDKQNEIIKILQDGIKVSVSSRTKLGDDGSDEKEKKRKTLGETTTTARKEVDEASAQGKKASTTVKDTGDYITKTAQKCGAEILNITKSVQNGVASTTASINNDYENAAKKTNDQILHSQDLGLFGDKANTGSDAQVALQSYLKTYQKLFDLVQAFKKLDRNSDEAKAMQPQINALQVALSDAEEKIVSISNNTKKFLDGQTPDAIFNADQLKNTGESLKLLTQSSEKAMVAFNGLYENGTKLLYDVYDPATKTFHRYSLEVDKATGYVRKLETAEAAVSNAFQTVNKAIRQNESMTTTMGDKSVNQDSSLWSKYQTAKLTLDNAVTATWQKAQSENRLVSLDEAKAIDILANKVLLLGQQIINTTKSFDRFNNAGGQTMDLVYGKAKTVEGAMKQMAKANAAQSKEQISNFSFNGPRKTLTYDLTDLEGKVRKVTMAYVDLFDQVKITSDKEKISLDSVTQAMNDNKDAILQATKEGYLDQSTDTYKEYTKVLTAYEKQVQKLMASDKDLTTKQINGLEQRRAKIQELQDALLGTAQANEKSPYQGTNRVRREIRANVALDDLANNDSRVANSATYKEYAANYKAMLAKKKEFEKSDTIGLEASQKEMQLLADKTEDARKKFEKLKRASDAIYAHVDPNSSTQTMALPNDFNPKNADMMSQAMRKMADETSRGATENWKFKDSQDGATFSMHTGAREVKKMQVKFDELSNSLVMQTVETKEVKTGWESFMDSLKGKWQEVARYLMTFASVYRVFDMIKHGIGYIKEIDAAMTELKKVTDETDDTYNKFMKTAAKTAETVGSTIQEVVSSTADFARVGYDLKQAAELAKNAQVLMNVSEFDNISTATDSLISVIKAFDYTADQSLHVVDILNKIGNNYAISTSDLAISLTKSSAALVAAGNTMEDAVALTAAANTILQDSEGVGNALKVVSMRLRGTTVKELEKAGEDTDGLVTSTSKLASKIQSLTAVNGKEGISILTDTGAYKSTYEIMNAIADRWEEIAKAGNDSALLELMAGKTRGSAVAALLQQPEVLKSAYEDAQNAAGSAMKENEKYLDSIQGRLDLFNNAVQTLWNNTINDDFIKFCIDAGTNLVKLADDVGGVQLAVAGLFVFLNKKFFDGDIFGKFFTKKGRQELFDKQQVDGIDEACKKLQKYKTDLDEAGKAYLENDSIINKHKYDQAQKKYDIYNAQMGNDVRAYQDEQQKLADLQKEKIDLTNQQKQAEIDLNDIQSGNVSAQLDEDVNRNEAIKAAEANLENVNTDLKKNQTEIDTTTGKIEAMGGAAQNAGNKATSAFTKMGKALGGLFQQAAYALLITSVITLFIQLGEALKDISETPQEEFERLNNELSSTKSELHSLESQLKTTQDQIDELLASGPLTFTQQEDLDRLRAESAELERQIGLKTTLQNTLQANTENAAYTASKDYLDNTSFDASDTKSERQESYSKTGKAAGTVAGVGLGAALAAGLAKGALAGTMAGPWGTLIGGAIGLIGGLVVGFVGEKIGEAAAGAEYDAEQSVGDAIDNMKEQRAGLINKQKKAEEAYTKDPTTKNKKKYDEATKALSDYDSAMAKHITQEAQYYSSIKDWDKLNKENPDKAEYWRSVGDALNKYAIEMGTVGAKETAIDRIFGDEATDKVKAFKQQVRATLAEGKDINFAQMLNENDFVSLKQRFANLGITLADLNSYFVNIKKAEDGALKDFSTEDAVKEIDFLTDGVKSLQDAFKELRTEGTMSATTLMKLQTVFGTCGEAWRNYVNTMSTGTASMIDAKKATNELAEAFINQTIASDNYNKDDYWTYVNGLEGIGVQNAQELIDAKRKEYVLKKIIGDRTIYDSGVEYDIADYETKNKIQLTDAERELIRKGIEKNAAKVAADSNKPYENQAAIDAYRLAVQNMQANYSTEMLNIEDVPGVEKHYEKKYGGNGIWTYQIPGQTTWMNAGEKVKYISPENKKRLAEYQAALAKLQAIYGDDVEDLYADDRTSTPHLSQEDIAHNVDLDLNRNTHIQSAFDWLFGIRNNEGASAQAADEAYAAVEKEWDAQMDAQGLKVELSFGKTSDLIDELQSLYDTLNEATLEYNKNGGFVSLDTYQSLLNLGESDTKYLTLLKNEQGNLKLTRDALYELTTARINDLAVQKQLAIIKAVDDAALAGDTARIIELTDASYDWVEATKDETAAKLEGLVVSLKVSGLSEEQQKAVYDSVRAQMDMVEKLREGEIQNLDKTISSSQGAIDQAREKAKTQYEYDIEFLEAQAQQIQNEISYAEESGQIVSEGSYQALKEINGQEIAMMQNREDDLRTQLAGQKKGTDAYNETAEALNDVVNKLDEARLKQEQYNNAALALSKAKYDATIAYLGNLRTELSNIIKLFDQEKVAEENGLWTEDGYTQLGLNVHMMEEAAVESQRVAKEIETLEKAYAKGDKTEKEYNADLENLKTQQYAAIDSYESAKDAIVELNKSRVEAIKTGVEKEITAYNDLVDTLKEALSAEKNLHDFQKSVAESNENIAKMERKLAAMSGSTDKATIAERQKLEADLYKAKQELTEQYYDNSIDSASEALDAESKSFEDSRNTYVTQLEEALKNTKQIIKDSILEVMQNADTILGALNTKASEYGFTLSDELIKPWEKWGAQAKIFRDQANSNLVLAWADVRLSVDDYVDALTNADFTKLYTGESNILGSFASAIQDNITSSWFGAKDAAQEYYLAAMQAASAPTKQIAGGDESGYNDHTGSSFGQSGSLEDPIVRTLSERSKDKIATIEGEKYYYNADDEVYYLLKDGSLVGSSSNHATYSFAAGTHFYKQRYAKGTTGVKGDQLALIDELGEELVLRADNTGRLSYMTKGSGVIPAEPTKNLVEWGKFDPATFIRNMVKMPSTAVAKNETNFELNFGELVHVDNCSQDAIPMVKKIVQDALDGFTRQMNYKLKHV